MSIAISLHNISKRYRLGTVNQRMFMDDLRDWRNRVFPSFQSKSAAAPVATPEFWALKDISFDIKKGETVGLIGTNGAGKSTLLKLLARVTTPTTGEMVINGRVGTLLEVGSGFHPELTGRDNVFLNGAVLGMSRAEIESKFDEILDFAELHQFIDTPVKRYSSGMRVRLAFSVAAIIEPEIMILDEVLAVGDLGFREKCLHRIEVLASGGQTGLFVSHSIGHVSRLCSRVIWLEKGTIRMDGDADVVCEEYRKAQIIKLAVHSPAPALHLAGESKNSAYQILGIETRDGLGRVVGRFRTGETCRIAVKYANNFPLNKEIEKVTLRLSILNEQGNRLIGLDSSLVKPKFIPLPETGTICFVIPKLPLMAGTYSFSVAFSINGELIDKVIPETFFQVEDGDFFGTQRVASASFTPLCVDFSCFLEQQTNPPYKIISIETRDGANRPVTRLRTGDICRISVKCIKNYSLDEDVKRATMVLSIFNEKGDKVLGLQSSLVKSKLVPFHDKSTVCFEIPKLPLVAGSYSFSVSLRINGEVFDESVPDVYLHVDAGDIYGTGRASLPTMTSLAVDFNCYLEEPINPAYKILDIAICDNLGRSANCFQTGEPCRINVVYSRNYPLDKEIAGVLWKLTFLDLRGDIALALYSNSVNPGFISLPDAATTSFDLHRIPFGSGTYTLAVSLIINGELINESVARSTMIVGNGILPSISPAIPDSSAPNSPDFDCHLEEEKNKAYRILDGEFQGTSGCAINHIHTGEACRIAVKYEKYFPLDEDITSARIKFVVRDLKDHRVIGLDSAFVNARLIPFPDASTVYFEIAKFPLVAGTYIFSALLILNGRVIDKLDSERFLLVKEGNFYGNDRIVPSWFTPITLDFKCYLDRNTLICPENDKRSDQ